MAGPEDPTSKETLHIEGKVELAVDPSGGIKGPGSKGGVFFNPAMVQNRDLSVLFLQYLSENDLLPGKRKRVLDGLCGSGARAIRLSVETTLSQKDVNVIGTDIDLSSIETARKGAVTNSADVEFIHEDLNKHLIKERYSYVDIDPFGSPVPFVHSAVQGVLNGGYLGITATDTAALTGSVSRVSRRRYGIESMMTHAYQEIACRSLMGYITRTAASFERGVVPVLFYVSDHFIRGYVRIVKGAKKADSSLEKIERIHYFRPGPPVTIGDELLENGDIKYHEIGPVWTGPLEDPKICNDLLKDLKQEKWSYMESKDPIAVLLERAASESGLPILGYDINILSSHLKMSPPSMEVVRKGLEGMARSFSRSRFSPTIFKTDAAWEEVVSIFHGGGF